MDVPPQVVASTSSPSTFYIVGTLEYQAPQLSDYLITNTGWISGMGNSYGTYVPNASFWVQDYGISEQPNRWTVDQSNSAIAQTTTTINGNSGSRAYPVIQSSDGSYLPGVGDAKDGVWQIDMQLGADGTGNQTSTNNWFCETFYLAERKDLTPGPANYLDGSVSSTGGPGAAGFGREIDIMETHWKPLGPQVNLPNGGGSSWNPDSYQEVQMANWSDIGNIPMTSGFITFGAYINGNNLWLYAYKADGTQWYSSDAIPLNSSYTQTGDFVPYIGTWTPTAGIPSTFSTKYKNFIYKPTSAIPSGVNPKDTPEQFWSAVTGS